MDDRIESSEGDKRLVQIAASLKSGKRVRGVTVRELLPWFGAHHRGVSINRVIREGLLKNDPGIGGTPAELGGVHRFHRP